MYNNKILLINNESGQYVRSVNGRYPFFTDDVEKAKEYDSEAAAQSDIKRVGRRGFDVGIA